MEIKKENLINEVYDYDVILIGTSIMNSLPNGFQYKVGLNFPKVYEAAKTATKYCDQTKLGTVTLVEGSPNFALCYITKGRYNGKDTVDYVALENCLKVIKSNFKDNTIASTIMGLSPYEGEGDRVKILNIFERIFKDCRITLYDYVQENIKQERLDDWEEVKKSIGSKEYENNKKRYFWKWCFGTETDCPVHKSLREIRNLVEIEKNKRKTFGSFNH